MQGGCFCGAVRYEIDPADHPAGNCHCSMCRRMSAAPFVSWLLVPRTHFRWTAGEPRALKSSEHGLRRFCADCGTPLACELLHTPEVIDITLCSLDDPAGVRPQGDYYTDTRLDWVPTPATTQVSPDQGAS